MIKEIHSEQGFTFVEMLIVIFLIGITAAIVMPRGLSQGIDNAAINTETEKLAGALRLTRQKAVTTAESHRILITNDRYYIYKSHSSTPGSPTGTLDEHVQAELDVGGDSYIEFDPGGITTQTGGIKLIEKSTGKILKELVIYSQGNVDIQSPQH